MEKTLKQVDEFKKAFDEPWLPWPGIVVQGEQAHNELVRVISVLEELSTVLKYTCAATDQDLTLVRFQLMIEELAEVGKAIHNRDLPNLLQELCDLRYVCDGTTLAFGLGDLFEKAFDEVHRANMSKLVDGKPLYSEAGRVEKGPNYEPPNLEQLFE